MNKKNKIELKYSVLGIIALPPFFIGFMPIEWMCNIVPNGIIGLFIIITYPLILGGIIIKYEKFLLKKYYKALGNIEMNSKKS